MMNPMNLNTRMAMANMLHQSDGGLNPGETSDMARLIRGFQTQRQQGATPQVAAARTGIARPAFADMLTAWLPPQRKRQP